MINMGALEMGLEENELRPIVQAWRKANPKIVKLWNIVGDAAVDAVRYQTRRKLPRGLSVVSDGKLMSIDFPSGRSLRYVRPRVVNGRYSEEVSYESYENGNWSRTSAWGGKLVENVCQGLARDCLRDAMMAVEMRYPEIVMHVHDEMVIEVAKRAAEMALKDICAIMGRKVDWAPELVLRGDGYTTTFYMKD